MTARVARSKSLASKTTAAVVAATVAVTGLLPLSSAAVAGGYGPGYGYGNYYAPPPPRHYGYQGYGYRHQGYRPHGYAQPHYYDYERQRRKKRRNDVAKAIAIGAGVAILGAIIANSGRRR